MIPSPLNDIFEIENDVMDPLENADGDDDGILEKDEYENTYGNGRKTNPTLKDSDFDGLPDGWEAMFFSSTFSFLDPTSKYSNSGIRDDLDTRDLINDGSQVYFWDDELTNLDEYLWYKKVIDDPNKSPTTPICIDSDADGWMDGEDVDPTNQNVHPDDTDGDGLPPLDDPDDDNDGLSDIEEWTRGSNTRAPDIQNLLLLHQ